MGHFAEKAQAREQQTQLCVVGRTLTEYDDEDKAVFTRLVSERKWTAISAIDDRLQDKSLKRHGAGVCMCPDGTTGKGLNVG